MQKAIYKEEVSIEKITFDKDEKKRLDEKKTNAGDIVRRRGTGDNAIYYQHRSLNNESTTVEDGQTIVTFADGRQILLSEDEAKEKLSSIKNAKAEVDEMPRIVLHLEDQTQRLATQEQTQELLTPGDEDKKKPGQDKKPARG